MVHPAPLVRARPVEVDELPRTAKSLVRHAETAGWTHCQFYAHGTGIDRHAQPTRLIESHLVRLRRRVLRAVAVWYDGSFETAYVWSDFTAPKHIGCRELTKFIKAGT